MTDYDTSSYNIQDKYKGMDFEDIRKINEDSRLPYGVCVLNLDGNLNTGMIIRTASLMGAERVIVFGRRRYDRRSTVGCHTYIDIDAVEGYENDGETLSKDKFLDIMNKYDYTPVFIENTEKAFEIESIAAFLDQGKLCLVLGNEAKGIPDNFLELGPSFIISQIGVNRCLNVSAAAAISMWEMQKVLSNNYLI